MEPKGIDGKKEKESYIDSFMEETLQGIFRLFHEMFENQVIGERTYMVLQFIQGVQILYFTFMDTFDFTWNEDPLFSAFRTIVKYFQVCLGFAVTPIDKELDN